MKTITIKKAFTFEGTVIAKGWKLDVPEFEIPLSDLVLMRFARGYQKYGASPAKGLEIALQASIRVCEVAWIRLLKASVGYWAKEYEERFGDLLGYDATKIGREFIPYDPIAWGRKGKAGMKMMLAEMRGRVT